MPKKLSEKRAPFVVTDPSMSRIIQQIYDDINDIVQSVNSSTGDDRDVSKGKVGDLRVVKRDNNDFRLEMMTEDGWYGTRPEVMVPLDKPNEVDVNVNTWTEISNFQNDWENWGPEKGATSAAFYRQDGRVYLKGQVKTGVAGTDSVIFTLPEGYRPEAFNIFPCIVSGTELGRIHILANGDVIMFSDDGTEKADNLTSLDGISFKVRE